MTIKKKCAADLWVEIDIAMSLFEPGLNEWYGLPNGQRIKPATAAKYFRQIAKAAERAANDLAPKKPATAPSGHGGSCRCRECDPSW